MWDPWKWLTLVQIRGFAFAQAVELPAGSDRAAVIRVVELAGLTGRECYEWAGNDPERAVELALWGLDLFPLGFPSDEDRREFRESRAAKFVRDPSKRRALLVELETKHREELTRLAAEGADPAVEPDVKNRDRW